MEACERPQETQCSRASSLLPWLCGAFFTVLGNMVGKDVKNNYLGLFKHVDRASY